MATLKQKLTFKEIGVNGGNISAAMRKAGYSKEVAKRTDKVTRTKGWAELMDKYINEADLAKRHNEQLNASKHNKLYFDIDDDDELIEKVCKKLGVELLYVKVNKAGDGKTANIKAPDFFFRDLALDKGYKVRGRYSDEGTGNTNNILIIQVSEKVANKNALDMNSDTSRDAEHSSSGLTPIQSS